MFSIADLAITSVETVTAFDITTGAYLWQLDELQNVSLAQGEERTDITGKQGRKITTLKRNKTLTLSGANGLLSHGLLESQTGGTFASASPVNVNWSESLVVNSHAALTTYKAVGTAGAEIKSLQIKNADGTLGAFLTQDSTAASGKFAYAPGTKTLTFHTDVADGTQIFVTYNRKISADRLVDYSDKYSGKAHIFVDAMAENKCGNLYRVQIEIPKGDFNGQVTWDMGDNQTVHNFEIEALSGACGATAGNTLFNYTVFGANAADYVGA